MFKFFKPAEIRACSATCTHSNCTCATKKTYLRDLPSVHESVRLGWGWHLMKTYMYLRYMYTQTHTLYPKSNLNKPLNKYTHTHTCTHLAKHALLIPGNALHVLHAEIGAVPCSSHSLCSVQQLHRYTDRQTNTPYPYILCAWPNPMYCLLSTTVHVYHNKQNIPIQHKLCTRGKVSDEPSFQVGVDLWKVQKQGREEKNFTTHYVTIAASSLASNAIHLHP